MKLLNDYFALQKQIYEYFGYTENWCVIPLEDYTSYYWDATDRSVVFADGKTPEEAAKNVQGGNYYSSEIYTQRHLPKWVYRGPEYTMICVDTHTDGNKFLSVFDNKKELKSLYDDYVKDY